MAKVVNKRIVHRQKILDNVDKALAMRLQGHSIAQIAEKLDLTSGRISQMLSERFQIIRENSEQNAQTLYTMELSRLDALMLAQWPQRANAKNAQVLLNIMARRHALLGIDAPTKVDANVRNIDAGLSVGPQLDLSKLDDEEIMWLERIILKAGPAADASIVEI